ncbi:Gamma-glutamyl cyclotransferase, AIG2-like [Tistlia consotensis]|uniref:Putative gamma-glutamylcyclotransferase n=1 Tax=Tistlia consotensis USBA 355 TaxID=560819 RepID=A0A1Y6B751_9PROT|nr:gamma-glutamylcyclotransferase family protein [Tistlia consotensis]SME87952.1 Gamma-glutamyl cyclotransferase, AIG2-like [Tistlia consotensis USBA 355]SNR24283.1 Gamma-glutamyl cyclotransferase, AIG2-like [Tistlia consotensis]
MRFFFYGTLLDADVRRLVLSESHARLELAPATLSGWVRTPARHGSFPVVRRHPGGRVRGLLAEGIDLAGLHRMAHFEGDGYTVGRQAVAAGGGLVEAHVFLPERRGLCLAGDWTLHDWQRRHKRRFLPRVERWMSEFGAAGPWSGDLSWHARRRIAGIARQAGDLPPGAWLRLAA